MDSIQKRLLEQVADLHEVPQGAYSLRINGSLHGKNSSENIQIVTKTDKPGIDIYVKPGTKRESLHIPVTERIKCASPLACRSPVISISQFSA